jgi:hypothetical protein
MASRRADARSLTVTIEGFDMPGRSCAPSDDDATHANIHAGMQRKSEVVELVAGDAPDARWSFELTTRTADDGSTDFGGPFVHGRRGDRFLYISWGDVDGQEFTMFRRAKLHFADIDTKVLAAARRHGALKCRVDMTDPKGNPRCAHVRAPDAVWTATDS